MQHPETYIAAIVQNIFGGRAEVSYRKLRASSQWDRCFDASGFAYVAFLTRGGVALTEDVMGRAIALEGSHGWSQAEALQRLAQRLESIYG